VPDRLGEASLWRAALTNELAFLSAGYDEPYPPDQDRHAVRDKGKYASDIAGLHA
jgi:hypothetical protein